MKRSHYFLLESVCFNFKCMSVSEPPPLIPFQCQYWGDFNFLELTNQQPWLLAINLWNPSSPFELLSCLPPLHDNIGLSDGMLYESVNTKDTWPVVFAVKIGLTIPANQSSSCLPIISECRVVTWTVARTAANKPTPSTMSSLHYEWSP